MSWEEFKIKREQKKDEKRIKKNEKIAQALSDANDKRVELSARDKDAQLKKASEEQFKKNLDSRKLAERISEARSELFVQRNKLVGRVIHFNNEYTYILKTMPETPKKQQELLRCSTGAKNATYALAMVMDSIERLDDIPSEYEWRELIRDTTKAMKLVNQISVGSDLVTRIAFLWQKAKYDLKGNISVDAMEHYYGRSIDKLLAEQKVDKVASELLVSDDALKLNNEKAILDAVYYGTIYNVQPDELASAAEQVNESARRNHTAPVYEEPDSNDMPEDMDEALKQMPSLM